MAWEVMPLAIIFYCTSTSTIHALLLHPCWSLLHSLSVPTPSCALHMSTLLLALFMWNPFGILKISDPDLGKFVLDVICHSVIEPSFFIASSFDLLVSQAPSKAS